MNNLKDKIYKAINKERENSDKFRLEGYEDNYDGFTHQSYSGLADDVINALYDEGIYNPTNKQIEDFVFQMF